MNPLEPAIQIEYFWHFYKMFVCDKMMLLEFFRLWGMQNMNLFSKKVCFIVLSFFSFLFLPCRICCTSSVCISWPGLLPSSYEHFFDVEKNSTPEQLQGFLNAIQVIPESLSEEKVLAAVIYVHGKQVAKELLYIVSTLDSYVLQWKKIRSYPKLYRLKQAPWRWWNSKMTAQQEVDYHLERLKMFRGVHAKKLGVLHDALHELRKSFLQNSEEKILNSARKTVLVIRSATCLSSCKKSISELGSKKSVRDFTLESVQASIGFGKKRTKESVIGLPGHFVRNVMPYLISTVGSSVALWLCWNRIPQWKNYSIKWLKKIYEQQIKNKVARLWNAIQGAEEKEDKLGDAYKKVCDYYEKIKNDRAKKKWHPASWFSKIELLGLEVVIPLLGRAIKIDKENIKSNALTTAVAALAVPAAVVYGGYCWLTSKSLGCKKVLNKLVRLRSAIDGTIGGRWSEHERRGMQIYILHDLKQRVSLVPSKNRNQFELDLEYIGSGDVSDVEKIRRIDAMIGPYLFLNA